MAAAPAPLAPPKAGGSTGSWFGRKSGPLPNWAWLSIGAAAVAAWYLWQRSQAASASSTTSPSTGPATGATGFGVGGGGGTGSTTPPTPTTSPLPFQVQSGSGWWQSPSSQNNSGSGTQPPITDANGNTYEWVDGAEYAGLSGSGEQIYFEPLPGVFMPVPAGLAGLAGGTPLYIQLPSGTGGNPAAPTSTSTSSAVAAKAA